MMPVRSGYPYCNDLVPGTSRRELETPWKLLWFYAAITLAGAR